MARKKKKAVSEETGFEASSSEVSEDVPEEISELEEEVEAEKESEPAKAEEVKKDDEPKKPTGKLNPEDVPPKQRQHLC